MSRKMRQLWLAVVLSGTDASRHFRRCYLKPIIKSAKVKRQGKFNRHITFESVLEPVMGEIKSRFDSIAIWIATKIWFKHCPIRFKYHAIWYWFDSNFNDSIQETCDLNRNLEVMVEIEYSFSLLTTQSEKYILKYLVLPITDVCPQ